MARGRTNILMTTEERIEHCKTLHATYLRAQEQLEKCTTYANAVIVQRCKRNWDEARAALPKPELVWSNHG